MSINVSLLAIQKPIHSWLRPVRVACVDGDATPLLKRFNEELLKRFSAHGHIVQPSPNAETDILITSAPFGEPLDWRRAYLFIARRKFDLPRLPTLFTALQTTPQRLQQLLERFKAALAKPKPDPKDFEFPGLAPTAYRTLYEQGKRGGPILSLIRMIQAQAKCIRILLLVGEEEPVEAYTFDLVGAHPRTSAFPREAFYEDIMLRMITAACTQEITHHQVIGEVIPATVWQSLSTPAAMRRAGCELGKRHFFTEMVRIADLVNVPAIAESVASQYSEGCFATWEPALHALIATITGSARPVDKDNLSDDELAVIVGVRPDGQGALVRHVEGKRNDPPSSEAVELVLMDQNLPRITLGEEWGFRSPVEVPVTRSKLHGHRSVRSYNPHYVEHVHLDPAYYAYPVSCSTEAQAEAICRAFSKSEALRNPQDPRQVVFTIMPGHGVVIVEKWVRGKEPFQVIWEYMDQGLLEIDPLIPQGKFEFERTVSGRAVIRVLE
ncbi:MAG: hypothetical protein RML93_08250 [Anaerolineales bacterium]|nr:hypothetical protein [Anaerolineales bacterium]MDW8447267.1 hypothetical protein [Anaerolineales bacterium]